MITRSFGRATVAAQVEITAGTGREPSRLVGIPALSIDGAAQQIAGNPNRKQLIITADPNNAGEVWIGSTEVGTGSKLAPNDVINLDNLTGDIDLIGTSVDDTLTLSEVI